MNKNSQHTPIFTITVQKKMPSLFSCPCAVFLDCELTVSKTQKCRGWVPPGASQPQSGVLGQTRCFSYAASEATLVVHWLSHGAKSRPASLGKSWQAAETARALLYCAQD